jgi:pimeloyl-ACP methyl ester carboxylesterase
MSSCHQISSGRATLAADVVGSGDAIVFLHAGVGNRHMWRSQLRGIGAQHTAIAYDRRGFGETRYAAEPFSAVADLMAVIDATTHGEPVILVGCSQGGRVAIDAALLHPSRIRAMVLIAPSVSGAPDPIYPADVKKTLLRLKDAEDASDLDRTNAIEAYLWLDGPMASEGRVTGEARQLFLDMNAIALRSPPTGSNGDVSPAFDRLAEITIPTLVIQGDLDFPHIQERSRYMATTIRNGSHHVLTGAAHLPSLERPADTTDLIEAFIKRFEDVAADVGTLRAAA